MKKVEVYLNTEMFSDRKITIEAHKQGTEYIPEQSNLESRGVIKVESLDHAYGELQHLDHPTLATNVLRDTRSVSVGDVLEVNEKFFIVRGVGFEEINYANNLAE